MTTEQKPEGATAAAEGKDWRSDAERNGRCRCGTLEADPSPGCAWHEAREERGER